MILITVISNFFSSITWSKLWIRYWNAFGCVGCWFIVRSAIEYCVKFFIRDVIFPFCHPSIISIYQYWVKSGTRILRSIDRFYATPKKPRKKFNRAINSQAYIRLVSYCHILSQRFIFRRLNNVSYKLYYNISVSKNGVLHI